MTVDTVIRYGGGGHRAHRKKKCTPQLGITWWVCRDWRIHRRSSALRESNEETSLEVRLIEQFHTYSDPRRDSRFHTVSVVFITDGRGILQGKDNAKRAEIFTELILSNVAFDHRQILTDYFYYIKNGKRPAYT